MAKKKKVEFISSGNYIVPKCNVIIEFLKNGNSIKKFTKHNSATLELCKYIRDALYGSYVIASKPGKIRICRMQGSNLVPISNTPFFPLVSIDREQADNIVNLYFKLPYDSIQGKKIEGLMLYSENATTSDDPYAYVKFDTTPIEVTTPVNIRIIWSLIVEQKKEV